MPIDTADKIKPSKTRPKARPAWASGEIKGTTAQKPRIDDVFVHATPADTSDTPRSRNNDDSCGSSSCFVWTRRRPPPGEWDPAALVDSTIGDAEQYSPATDNLESISLVGSSDWHTSSPTAPSVGESPRTHSPVPNPSESRRTSASPVQTPTDDDAKWQRRREAWRRLSAWRQRSDDAHPSDPGQLNCTEAARDSSEHQTWTKKRQPLLEADRAAVCNRGPIVVASGSPSHGPVSSATANTARSASPADERSPPAPGASASPAEQSPAKPLHSSPDHAAIAAEIEAILNHNPSVSEPKSSQEVATTRAEEGLDKAEEASMEFQVQYEKHGSNGADRCDAFVDYNKRKSSLDFHSAARSIQAAFRAWRVRRISTKSSVRALFKERREARLSTADLPTKGIDEKRRQRQEKARQQRLEAIGELNRHRCSMQAGEVNPSHCSVPNVQKVQLASVPGDVPRPPRSTLSEPCNAARPKADVDWSPAPVQSAEATPRRPGTEMAPAAAGPPPERSPGTVASNASTPLRLESDPFGESALVADSKPDVTTTPDLGKSQGQEKIGGILRFLEEVDQSTDSTNLRISVGSVTSQSSKLSDVSMSVEGTQPSRCDSSKRSDLHRADRPEPTGLASQVYDQVKVRMEKLKVELDHRDKMIEKLKMKLSEQKKQGQADAQRQKRDLELQAEAGRAELEETVKRQLAFIDRLLKDKSELAGQCESLTDEIQAMSKRHTTQMSERDEEVARELKRQRESWAATEKAKREKWQAEKTKEIKAMTLKGLEPEVQRMVEKQKVEMKRMEERMAEELRSQREHMQAAQQRELDEMRSRLQRERDLAVERERDQAAQRLSEMNSRFDAQLASQRMRWVSDGEQERQDAEKRHREEKQRLEDAQEKLKASEARRVAELKAEHTASEEEMQRRHAAELKMRAEKEKIERDEWQREMLQKFEADSCEARAKAAQELQKERDDEIEMVITRLQEESEAERQKILQEATSKVAMKDEHYAQQLHEAKESERQWMEKYMQVCKDNSSTEERTKGLKQQVLELQEELGGKAKALVKLESQLGLSVAEAERREAQARSEADTRVAHAAAERRRAEQEVRAAEERAEQLSREHATEIEKLKKEKYEALDKLNERVRATISKKDESMASLSAELSSAQARCRQYEELLERQRVEFLGGSWGVNAAT